MEYIWYIFAALGAGIGTGLAGLSAATVMVPILIVLCPSFIYSVPDILYRYPFSCKTGHNKGKYNCKGRET